MKLNEIKLNSENPRKIDRLKLEQLKQSIKEFPKMMELRPIVIDSNNKILGGNQRYTALKELGYTEMPDTWIKRADELTKDEKRRFIIVDNLPFGEWDINLEDWDSGELAEWGLELESWGNEVNDIEEIEDFDESVNFAIKCNGLAELEQLQNKMNTKAKQIDYSKFIDIVGV